MNQEDTKTQAPTTPVVATGAEAAKAPATEEKKVEAEKTA